MSQKIFINPRIGDKLTFLKTAEETGGEYTLMRIDLAPHGGNPLHYHTSFTEEFRVISGKVSVKAGGKKLVLKRGQAIKVPQMMSHRFYSESDEPAAFLVEIRPGSPNFERSLKIAYSLAFEGKCFKMGIPKNLLHLAYLLEASESYSPGIPLFLQKQFFKTLAAVAKRFGIDRDLDRYCG